MDRPRGPNYKSEGSEYFEEQRKEKERRARIADKIKTLVVTKKEDIIIRHIQPSGNLISSVIL